jgi:3-oxoacyl-(acyl-carrier-protein) synthase
MRRVVITGLGVIAPNGNGLSSFTENLKSGKSGIRFIQKLKDFQFRCQIGGVPQNLEELKRSLFSEEDLLTMNESLTLAAIAGLECWLDAHLPDPKSTPNHIYEDTGAVIGVGMCGMDTISDCVVPMINEGKVKRLGGSIVENVMASGPSAKLCSFLGLGGQVTTNSSACVTGTEAIVDAYFKIKEGRINRALAGGVEGSSPYMWGGFDSMKVLQKNFNDHPEKGSRPLSATTAGFVPGAGAGILMLEELETALLRGAPIYAEILGVEVNSGGQRLGGSMTAPGPAGVERCIKKALERAKITPQEIDFVNGHLTGTFADPHEIRNLTTALQLSPTEFPLIQSTKSMIGHALGAAGGIECVATILQLHEGFIHGSINCEDLHPELLEYREKIPQKTLYTKANIAMKVGFGFGDVNSCIIFKKWNENEKR